MLTLLSFEEIFELLPILFVPFVFVIAVVVIIVVTVKRAKAEQRKENISEEQRKSLYPFTDGNGRTEHQRDYLNAKRREAAERKVAAQKDTHTHSGKKETYTKIVGSLGEVNDEGCDELDGVRLIEHDEAYCDDPEHMMPTDTTDIQKAIVLGEVLNTPRFKQMYRRNK